MNEGLIAGLATIGQGLPGLRDQFNTDVQTQEKLGRERVKQSREDEAYTRLKDEIEQGRITRDTIWDDLRKSGVNDDELKKFGMYKGAYSSDAEGAKQLAADVALFQRWKVERDNYQAEAPENPNDFPMFAANADGKQLMSDAQAKRAEARATKQTKQAATTVSGMGPKDKSELGIYTETMKQGIPSKITEPLANAQGKADKEKRLATQYDSKAVEARAKLAKIYSDLDANNFENIVKLGNLVKGFADFERKVNESISLDAEGNPVYGKLTDEDAAMFEQLKQKYTQRLEQVNTKADSHFNPSKTKPLGAKTERKPLSAFAK